LFKNQAHDESQKFAVRERAKHYSVSADGRGGFKGKGVNKWS
jgi:hypothetical protein